MKLNTVALISVCCLVIRAAYQPNGSLTCLLRQKLNSKPPKQVEQKDYQPWSFVFIFTRKRIEVVFAQLSDQIMIKRNNYAKTLVGLRTRIMVEVTSLTVLQYIYSNHLKGKPLNQSNMPLLLKFQSLNKLFI
jgi:hypothetical protein